jgi:hypothetical protein
VADDDRILENLPDYTFDLLDAAQRLLQKLDDISLQLNTHRSNLITCTHFCT